MSFDFDTGATAERDTNFVDAWESAIRDRVGYPCTEREYHQEAARELINEMWSRKKAETVRKRFWSRMWMLNTIARDDPDIHDKIIEEFAERLNMLTGSPEESGETRETAIIKTEENGEHDYGF